MDFQYPLSVIAEKNGSGKSTILAMACCAYHKWNISKERAEEILDSALLAGKHNEFHSLQEALGTSREVIIADIVNTLKSETNVFNTISDIVQMALAPQSTN